jgi:hypothetical protein
VLGGEEAVPELLDVCHETAELQVVVVRGEEREQLFALCEQGGPLGHEALYSKRCGRNPQRSPTCEVVRAEWYEIVARCLDGNVREY